MREWLPVILLLYFLLFFGVAFIGKTILVAKRINKSPLVLPKDDSAYGLIGVYFKQTLIILFLYVVAYAVFPEKYEYFLPINWLELSLATEAGLVMLVIAFAWTVIAQYQMKNSWRIGIDTQMHTPLVTTGLFSVSRNPVFGGMLLALSGLFLVTPNGFTLLLLVVGYILIQVQIRLEEEFLEKQYGAEYIAYKQKTKRLI
ncbi:MAG: isoprenylcysteine carboxylmethyltransferase family protein [Chitinophagaceae bacterium]|nr:isoprenylcysteine carboxylmethyltransferase family protein [Chitinophagaceae bacterium]MCW5927263.1 isoprenylcysteine carboxylmethyltransferase family protein [Chitinophagaceae bacterium]